MCSFLRANHSEVLILVLPLHSSLLLDRPSSKSLIDDFHHWRNCFWYRWQSLLGKQVGVETLGNSGLRPFLPFADQQPLRDRHGITYKSWSASLHAVNSPPIIFPFDPTFQVSSITPAAIPWGELCRTNGQFPHHPIVIVIVTLCSEPTADDSSADIWPPEYWGNSKWSELSSVSRISSLLNLLWKVWCLLIISSLSRQTSAPGVNKANFKSQPRYSKAGWTVHLITYKMWTEEHRFPPPDNSQNNEISFKNGINWRLISAVPFFCRNLQTIKLSPAVQVADPFSQRLIEVCSLSSAHTELWFSKYTWVNRAKELCMDAGLLVKVVTSSRAKWLWVSLLHLWALGQWAWWFYLWVVGWSKWDTGPACLASARHIPTP